MNIGDIVKNQYKKTVAGIAALAISVPLLTGCQTLLGGINVKSTLELPSTKIKSVSIKQNYHE